jgi:NodT family efflux transporter outer membrane factor (OMF) lipoprotein
MKYFSLVIISLLVMNSCAVGPDYVRPDLYLPASYTEEPLEEETPAVETRLGDAQHFIEELELPKKWWELFQSEPLNGLVEASLRQNPTVEIAWTSLGIAIQNVRAEQGLLYPQLSAEFTPTRQKESKDLSSNVSSNAYYYSLYTPQLIVTYTADVFGAIRRQVESLEAQAASECFNIQATYLTLTTNVVNAAIQEASLRGQITATKEIIAIQKKLLELYQGMYDLGNNSEADVSIQKSALALSEAALPPLEKQLAIQRDLLKVLAGLYPSDHLEATFDLDSLKLPIDLPLSLPSSLVENRPDVRMAEELMHSASAAIGVAKANRFPSITIGPDLYGWASTTWKGLFHSATLFWELAGTIAQPVFDGGTLKAKEQAAWDTFNQTRAQYRETVLSAFQNVADSLQAIKMDSLALEASYKAERAAARSLEISTNQLSAGDINILILLATRQTYQQALLSLVQAQANRLSDTVALFQSLGGGWWNVAP